MRSKIVRQWLRIVLGLLVFAFGVHLTIYANIGLAPWDCLGMGIAKHTPLNYGLSMTAMALIILCIDLMLKERIGYGTIIDALLTGNFVQMFNDLNPLEENKSTWLGILIMLCGFVFMALGMWIYMKGEQCCGPKRFAAGRTWKASPEDADRHRGGTALGGRTAGRMAVGRTGVHWHADQHFRSGTCDAGCLQRAEV